MKYKYIGTEEQLKEFGFNYSSTFEVYYRWNKNQKYACKIFRKGVRDIYMTIKTSKSLTNLETKRVKEQVIQDLIEANLVEVVE